jgi:hypothetical protein
VAAHPTSIDGSVANPRPINYRSCTKTLLINLQLRLCMSVNLCEQSEVRLSLCNRFMQ